MNFRFRAVSAVLSLGMAAIVVTGTAEAGEGCGRASWYALHSKTASGERMNPSNLTAAHRSLRFGTKLRVTNMRNGKSVVVRVNDRGPFIRGRVLDLSRGAARSINMVDSGTAKVCYQIIG
jgi:rare lipoprotein A